MKIYEKLIYLDKEFISSMYEEEKGISPNTAISRSESLNATAKIPLFSGGASTTECKSFSISTVGMLKELFPILEKYPQYHKADHKMSHPSFICWAEGSLTIHSVERTSGVGEKKKVLGKENYFALVEQGEKFTLAIVPTKEYWTSGVSTFQTLIENVIGPIEMPVRMLVRIYSAETSFDEPMAIPILIIDKIFR
jgi:hypothetical protein